MDQKDTERKPPLSPQRIRLAILGACVILAGIGCGVWGFTSVKHVIWVVICGVLISSALVSAGALILSRSLRNGDFVLRRDVLIYMHLEFFCALAFLSIGLAISGVKGFSDIEALKTVGVRISGNVTYTAESRHSKFNHRHYFQEYVHFTVDGRQYTAKGKQYKRPPTREGPQTKVVVYLSESPDINETVDNPKTTLLCWLSVIGGAIGVLFFLLKCGKILHTAGGDTP